MNKYLFLLVAVTLSLVSCREYDDSELIGRVDNLEERVSRLETLCNQMNTNIISLQTIVTALQQNDYITFVTPITEGDATIGYTITFTKSAPITIYHGKNGRDGQDGKDGTNGKDGYTPVIGVRQDTDGIYYWTLDGEWLLDADGNKIKAVGTDGKDGSDGKDGVDGKEGITPQLKIENCFWYITYNDGNTWVELGQATGDNGEKGDSFFHEVRKDDEYVYFVLSDGTQFTLPIVSDGLIVSMKFLAKQNSLNLSNDMECTIGDDGKIFGHIPNIVSSKQMIPTFEFTGQRVLVDSTIVISGETILDFSKPVTMTVIGNNGIPQEYVVEIMAFTGLPVVYINTENNQQITSKEEYLNATIRIIEDIHTRGAGDIWEDSVKIKGRGNSTWGLPKKPYKLKFNSKQSLLGEPKDKEWVLLANYTDKTSIRNELAFYMGRMSNLEYTCRTHFVDLVLNNVYIGTYQLGEQLKIAEDRVNVGDEGYLLEIDAKAAGEDITFKIPHISQPINIKDPDVELGGDAYNYIVDYMQRVDSVLFDDNFTDPINGYAKYIDVSSFVDWYLINEISKNNDACFFTSCYMNLSRGGQLKMGPLWDFDIAFGNVNYNGCDKSTGFWIKSVSWYARLFKDKNFVAKVKERFDYFYTNKEALFNEINENADYLKYSVVENNAVWGTLYEYTWPNYAIWGSYDNEVAYLKQWLNTRMEWLKKEFDTM